MGRSQRSKVETHGSLYLSPEGADWANYPWWPGEPVGGGGAVPILDYISPTSSNLNPLIDLELFCYCDASLTYHADMWVMIDDKRYEYDGSWNQQVLTVIVPKADLAVSGVRQVRVVDAAGESLPQPLTVEAAPPLTLTSYSPNPIAASYAGGVTVTGASFDATTEFYLDGGAFDPSWVVVNTSTRATITAPSKWVSGSHVLTAFSEILAQNSNELPVTVAAVAPVAPTLTSLTPNSVTAGSSDTIIGVNGTGFGDAAGAVAMLSGETPMATTYYSPTQLSFILPANWMNNPATFQMSVVTAEGTSNALPLTVAAAPVVPVITGLAPTSLPVGSAQTTVAVAGTGFVAGSVVVAGGANMVTTYVNATQLSCVVPSTYFAVEGSLAFYVDNLDGSTSNVSYLTVTAAVAPPTITFLSPGQAPAGSPDVPLDVMGTGYDGTCQVVFDDTPLTNINVGATSISTTIPTAKLTTAGDKNVRVQRGADGLASSNTLFAVMAVAARGKKKR